jgi:hypothetical protein
VDVTPHIISGYTQPLLQCVMMMSVVTHNEFAGVLHKEYLGQKMNREISTPADKRVFRAVLKMVMRIGA